MILSIYILLSRASHGHNTSIIYYISHIYQYMQHTHTRSYVVSNSFAILLEKGEKFFIFCEGTN